VTRGSPVEPWPNPSLFCGPGAQWPQLCKGEMGPCNLGGQMPVTVSMWDPSPQNRAGAQHTKGDRDYVIVCVVLALLQEVHWAQWTP
jgi:hypothetical protein